MEECPECHEVGLYYDPRIQKPSCTICYWRGETMTEKEYREWKATDKFFRQRIPHFNPEFSFRKVDKNYFYEE